MANTGSQMFLVYGISPEQPSDNEYIGLYNDKIKAQAHADHLNNMSVYYNSLTAYKVRAISVIR